MTCLFLAEVTALMIIAFLIMKTECFPHLCSALYNTHLATVEMASAFETGLIFFTCYLFIYFLCLLLHLLYVSESGLFTVEVWS